MKQKATGDLVPQEIWRIKDTLSASYGRDVKRLFAETRKRQKLSDLGDAPILLIEELNWESKLLWKSLN